MNSAKWFTETNLELFAVIGPKRYRVLHAILPLIVMLQHSSYQSGLPSPLTLMSAKSSNYNYTHIAVKCLVLL